MSVAAVSTALGASFGIWAGFVGGRTDAWISWLIDVLMSIPAIPMLVAIAVLVANSDSSIGVLVAGVPEWTRIVVVMSFLGWLGTARVLDEPAT